MEEFNILIFAESGRKNKKTEKTFQDVWQKGLRLKVCLYPRFSFACFSFHGFFLWHSRCIAYGREIWKSIKFYLWDSTEKCLETCGLTCEKNHFSPFPRAKNNEVDSGWFYFSHDLEARRLALNSPTSLMVKRLFSVVLRLTSFARISKSRWSVLMECQTSSPSSYRTVKHTRRFLSWWMGVESDYLGSLV